MTTDGRLTPELWPSPQPLSDRPQQLREANGIVTPRSTINSISARIEYYPELQIATLKQIANHPNKAMLQAMAEAVLDVITPDDETPTDALRVEAIDAVIKSLRAAVDYVDGKRPAPKGGPPF